MSYPHYRSQFGDTTFTKVFVGGLAWETPTDEMRTYFEQFGEILEAVIIVDKNTGKSKGYGFVTFRDSESARRACAHPNPVIDGRRANCNIASLGRLRPSPPRGRNQGASSPYQGSAAAQVAPSHSRAPPLPPPLPPQAPTIMYPSYSYPTYTPADYGYHQQQAMYNPQLHHQQHAHYFPHQAVYGSSSSSSPMGSPYYYHGGYPFQSPSPRGAFSTPQAQRIPAPSYLYYPSHMEPSFSSYPLPPPPPLLQQPPTTRHHHPPNLTSPPAADSQNPQYASTETEAGVVISSETTPDA